MREERHGHQVQHRHQDRGQQQGVQVAEGKFRQRGQHSGEFCSLSLLTYIHITVPTSVIDGTFQTAEAQLAYELQAAKIQQRIRNEEIQIQVMYLVSTALDSASRVPADVFLTAVLRLGCGTAEAD